MKELLRITLEKSILIGYYKAKDKKNYIQILFSSYYTCLSQGRVLKILKLLYVYARSEQINKYIIETES